MLSFKAATVQASSSAITPPAEGPTLAGVAFLLAVGTALLLAAGTIVSGEAPVVEGAGAAVEWGPPAAEAL